MLRFYDENKNPLCSLTNTNKTIMFHVYSVLLCFMQKSFPDIFKNKKRIQR